MLAQLGGALMGAGRWAESRTLCEAAIDCAGKAGARSEESRARNLLGSDLVALGEIDAGIEQLRLACAIAAEVGPADMLILGHFNLALNLLTAGRLHEALPEAEAGRRAARAAGLERRLQDLVALTADILLRLGRVPEAGEAVREGLALDPAGEGTVYLSIEAARLASIRGDAAEARRRLGAIDLDAVDPDVAASAAAVAAEAYAWEGRPADALGGRGGLRRLEGLDDVLWTAPLVWLGLRASAALADTARLGRGGQSGEPTAAVARLELAPRGDRRPREHDLGPRLRRACPRRARAHRGHRGGRRLVGGDRGLRRGAGAAARRLRSRPGRRGRAPDARAARRRRAAPGRRLGDRGSRRGAAAG